MIDVMIDLWQFLRIRKKFWMAPDSDPDYAVGSLGRFNARICCRAVYLYIILNSSVVARSAATKQSTLGV